MPAAIGSSYKKVIVHPTVLLEMVDHMRRVIKTDRDHFGGDRVVGALLGSVRNNIVDVSNCYGVPFAEKDNLWVLDIDYAENMLRMLRKINASESVVGWYQTSSSVRSIDTLIHERFTYLMKSASTHVPIMIQLDHEPKDQGLPAKAYIITEQAHDDGRQLSLTFRHIPIETGAEEAEEVGTEHLLRDIGSYDTNNVSQGINETLLSLCGLSSYIDEIIRYLNGIQEGKLELNQEIFEKIQSVIYELPLLAHNDVHKALLAQNNNDASISLVALLMRTVIALNKLINNKIKAQIGEKKADKVAKTNA